MRLSYNFNGPCESKIFSKTKNVTHFIYHVNINLHNNKVYIELFQRYTLEVSFWTEFLLSMLLKLSSASKQSKFVLPHSPCKSQHLQLGLKQSSISVKDFCKSQQIWKLFIMA